MDYEIQARDGLDWLVKCDLKSRKIIRDQKLIDDGFKSYWFFNGRQPMRWLVEECRNAIHWGNRLRGDPFKSRHLGYLVLLAIPMSLAVGIILFLVGPNIKSPIDGIWSAWVTMTHVGFGDVVPASFWGRLLAAAPILLGLVFFSLFTALVSVILIGRNMDALGMEMRRIEHEGGDIQTGKNQVFAGLARLKTRMEELEQQLSSNTGGGQQVNLTDQ
jgi:hypothetical protein